MRVRVVVACVVSGTFGFAAAVVVHPWSAGASSAPAVASVGGATVLSVHTTQRLVALTFDDGPDPRWTPQVLDQLHDHAASATFFDTGLNASAHPDLVRAEIGAGDEIGDHTWSHRDLRTLSMADVESEIVKGAQAIQDAGAPKPRWFRPPYGATDGVVSVVAGAEGFRTVGWSFAVEHYVNHTPVVAAGVEALLARVRPGAIILAHDGGVPDRSRTMSALGLLLDGLRARGYRVVDVATLLAASSGPRAA